MINPDEVLDRTVTPLDKFCARLKQRGITSGCREYLLALQGWQACEESYAELLRDATRVAFNDPATKSSLAKLRSSIMDVSP